jgi:hypothetical protein
MNTNAEIIDIKNEKIAKTIFQFISDNTTLSHVLFNNVPYYERSNIWINNDVDPNLRHLDDPDVECDEESYDCYKCEANSDIYPTEKDTLSYIVKFTNKRNPIPNDMNFIATQISNCDLDVDTYILLLDNDPENIFFSGFDKLLLLNTCGRNDDHRGSTHCKVFLNYESEIMKLNKDDINLRYLAECYYRLKSHKFDKWYELFTGLKYSKIFGRVKINLEFDHGS